MEMQTRKLFHQDSDVKIETQLYEDCVFLHVEVMNWTPSVLKRCYRLFAKLEDSCIKAGFSKMATITPNPKFVKLFGGTTVQSLIHDNQDIEVILWELK